MMSRRWLATFVSAFILLAAVGGYLLLSRGAGTGAPKVHKVGILCGLSFLADTVVGFKAEMASRGYVDGQSIAYDLKETNFDLGEYRRILKGFVDEKVDLIFVTPTEASMEAKAITKGTGIPVVFTFANIEDTGLVDSVRHPGGNVTGSRYPGPDIAAKRFEIMCELAPDVKRILVPYQRGYPIVPSQLMALQEAVAGTGITLVEAPADSAAELEADLNARAASDDIGFDAILGIAEPLAVTPDGYIVMATFAAEHKMPFGGALISIGEHVSLFGVNPRLSECGKQAALLADRILKGASPDTVPVVSADSYFELNYGVAMELGLTVSEGMLSRADNVIR
jgi:putative ABC transport system substrate-binding protein